MVTPLMGEVTATFRCHGHLYFTSYYHILYCAGEITEKSVAVQVTVVVPTGKPPDGASLVTTGEEVLTISVTVAFPRDTCVRVSPEDTVLYQQVLL